MVPTGIARIDALFAGDPGAQPLARDENDPAAVGAIQDLLIGHGARLPGILGQGRGVFGPQTEAAVAAFQAHRNAQPTGKVNPGTLQSLAEEPAVAPLAAQGYLGLVLDVPWTGFARLVALTAQFEAAGKFTARNRNTDRAGLSFGILQWAQKPGRLNGLLRAFERVQPDKFVAVLGGGEPAVASGLIAHTAKPSGGVTQLGHTTDPAFDLVNDVWSARFVEAGRDRIWQETQLAEAMTAFKESCNVIRGCAPIARSERALAFLLDVANQHGNGGLRNLCAKCTTPAMTEPAFLQAVQDESVRRLKAQFGDGSPEAVSTLNRRTAFRTSALLSTDAFQEA